MLLLLRASFERVLVFLRSSFWFISYCLLVFILYLFFEILLRDAWSIPSRGSKVWGFLVEFVSCGRVLGLGFFFFFLNFLFYFIFCYGLLCVSLAS